MVPPGDRDASRVPAILMSGRLPPNRSQLPPLKPSHYKKLFNNGVNPVNVPPARPSCSKRVKKILSVIGLTLLGLMCCTRAPPWHLGTHQTVQAVVGHLRPRRPGTRFRVPEAVVSIPNCCQQENKSTWSHWLSNGGSPKTLVCRRSVPCRHREGVRELGAHQAPSRRMEIYILLAEACKLLPVFAVVLPAPATLERCQV